MMERLQLPKYSPTLRNSNESEGTRPTAQDSEDLYRDLAEYSQDLLCTHDLEGRLLSVNPAPARVLGYSVEELLQRSLRDLLVPEFRDQFDEYLARIRRDGFATGTMAIQTRTGAPRIWEYHNTLQTQGVAAPIVRGIAHDITERKRAEQSLRQREDRFRQLVEHIHDATITDDAAGKITFANDQFLALFGFEREQLPHLKLEDYVAPEWREQLRDRHDRRVRGETVPTRFEYEGLRQDGRRLWLEVDVVPLKDGTGRVIGTQSAIRDITERKRAEDALQESETKFKTLFEMANDAILISRGETFSDCNLRAETLFGCRREDIVGHSPLEFSPSRQPDGRLSSETIAEKIRAAMRGVPQLFEWKHVRRNGTPFDAEVSLSRVVIPGAEYLLGSIRDITERKRVEEVVRQNEQRMRMLLEINNALVSKLELSDLFRALSLALRAVFRQDFAGVALYDSGKKVMRAYALDLPLAQDVKDVAVPVNESLTGEVLRAGEIKLFRRPDLERVRNDVTNRLLSEGMQSFCCIPLKTSTKKIGVLVLGSRKTEAFCPADFGLMMQIATQVALAVDNAHAYQHISQLKDKLTEEKLYLESEIQSGLDFDEIIGESPSLKQALGLVSQVAPLDSTVLLLGETGTGKELFARAIHRKSARSNGAFIKMNCAAIPTGLLESELFGHEKGAFTGAINHKLGRLELADKGTLFLDEVGEIPLELQPKLLRVLQDHEFERLGSTRTIRVDLRLIAATNRDLIKSVVERRFRSDLYYRLHVFPIRLPALRERRTDIPLLITHFLQKHAKRMGKRIESVPRTTVETLMNCDWPGNIRELENLIERSVILTPGSVLQVPLHELALPKTNDAEASLATVEREHILKALRESQGRISGLNGAAKRLGLNRTTLESKLQRMGISPSEYRNDRSDPS